MERFALLIALVALLVAACTPQSTPQSTPETSGTKNVGYGDLSESELTGSVGSVEPKNEGQDLTDYLRRIPGIVVMGSGESARVMVRGGASQGPGALRGPLFVVDDVPISNYYSDVARMVDLNDIKSVDVLKDVGSTTIYGTRGKDGVIMINLKKAEDDQKKKKKKNQKEEEVEESGEIN